MVDGLRKKAGNVPSYTFSYLDVTLNVSSKKSDEQVHGIYVKWKAQNVGSILKLMLKFWACQDRENHKNYKNFLVLHVSIRCQNQVAALVQEESSRLAPSLSLML